MQSANTTAHKNKLFLRVKNGSNLSFASDIKMSSYHLIFHQGSPSE